MAEPIKRIRIGTRGSRLALAQAGALAAALKKAFPGLECEIVEVRTSGDADLETRISDSRSTGVFVREIETELLLGKVDLAVHSLKDLPTALPSGLILGAVLPRGDCRDAALTRDGTKLADLKAGSTVATGSYRRQAQVLALRPDLKVVPVRGNVDTRIRKLMDGEFDALIVAAAALERLGDRRGAAQVLDPEEFVPAAGQGIIGVEITLDDPVARLAAASVNDEDVFMEAEAERAFIRRLGSGCSLPAGARASAGDIGLDVWGFISRPDGTSAVRGRFKGGHSNAADAGEALADDLLRRGGRRILDEFSCGRP